MINIAVDAMGGDNAPGEIVKGAVLAVNKKSDVKVVLVGRQNDIKNELNELSSQGISCDEQRLEIVNAEQVIDMHDHPVEAIRTKRDSSLVVAMKLVHDGYCKAIVSAGNSGAVMVGGQVVVGRQKGVDRAPFAFMLPTTGNPCLMLDCGANVDVRAEHLCTFAKLGSDYYREMRGTEKPTVALVNCGTEEEKGNALVKEAYPMLKELEGINFIGFVEPSEIPKGFCDVAVCDGFAGNCMLKMYEGVAKSMMSVIKQGLMTSFISKIGALLAKKSLKKTLKKFDEKQYGGAPVLGLRGLVVKNHGHAEASEICVSILQCAEYKNPQD